MTNKGSSNPSPRSARAWSASSLLWCAGVQWSKESPLRGMNPPAGMAQARTA